MGCDLKETEKARERPCLVAAPTEQEKLWRQTGCDLNNIENNEPFMLAVYVGGTQSLYYDILHLF